MPKALSIPLMLSGLLLICAPLIIYALDSLIGLGRLDPLTLSTLIGTLGAGLLAFSQGDRWPRFFLALGAGLGVLILQIYGIVFLVLASSGL
ncbi:hypothetical protein [Henriciella sp.]|uniref:hypothetical protein n=1 Tax=Henriciella sp. TaxID=1968823 RepID=UPI00183F174F|nr:hypothetical protein [Henriciella sp.]HIG23985.1 hypothetical protein [Henriciella sp.]